jgi:signal transduction histidine kinase
MTRHAPFVLMSARLGLVATAGLVAGVGAVLLAAHSSYSRPTEPGVTLIVVVGASLLVSGLLSWRRRPENRLGPVMVATAFVWFASMLVEADTAWLFTIGEAIQYAWIAGIVCILVSFPSGRMIWIDRVLVAAIVVLALGLQLVAMLFGDKAGLRCSGCPSNTMRVSSNNALALDIQHWQRVGGGALAVAVIALLIVRRTRASQPRRRAAEPVLPAGIVAMAALIGTIVNDLTGDPFNRTPSLIFFYTSAAVPIAVLVVFLQRRLARGNVAGLVVQLGKPTTAAGLRDTLARTLGDPSLELAFWLPEEKRYVSEDGRPVLLPDPGGDRRATVVERDGQPVAALLHDPALEQNEELVQSVGAAAALALENERLQAELRAQLAELRASRARLVEATDVERRRIERNLHDGTQQRLVSIAMSLGLLESKLPEGSAEAPTLVRETREALALALEELRDLTQGIHPTLLVERGLPAALDELCRRAALPVQVELELDHRLAEQAESAAYFFASEALANAAKHSHAANVRVRASSDGGTLTVEVADDGIGGAAPGGGSGLRGLTDRVEALGGRLTISSPPGRGTTLRAEIPCG